MNFWQIFSVAMTVAAAIEGVYQAISNGQPAATPPVNTYIGGKHGQIVITWTPLP